MNNFGLFIFVMLCKICILMDLVYSSSLENNLDIFKRKYGEGYGTEWIYFPDGAGELHYINLSMKLQDEELIGQDKIEFRLYTGKNNTYILLDNRGRAVKKHEQELTTYIMRLHQPLKIITHGWRSSANIKDILNMKSAYLSGQKVNVITVDWNPTASELYPLAAYKTACIGNQIASFLDSLNKRYGVTGDILHLIGHSLGAHVMGIAASKTKSTVHRVTGLDPAKPLFELVAFDKRIDASNAEIVDIIHTCAGVLGFQGAVGTVDFYPNGGTVPQPGCEGILKLIEACSHSIAMHYFMESIKYPIIYPAYKCESWQLFLKHQCSHKGYMGDGVNKDMTGKYYLKTNVTQVYHYAVPTM